MEFFKDLQHSIVVDVTMCDVHDERDAWMMLMDLSDIKKDLLDKLDENAKKQVDTSLGLKKIVGMMKQQYIVLKVVQLLKETHQEFDAVWGH